MKFRSICLAVAAFATLGLSAARPALSGTQYHGAIGLASDKSGNIFVSSVFDLGDPATDADTVWQLDASGKFAPIMGHTGCNQEPSAAINSETCLAGPKGLATDSAGNLYVADEYHGRILKRTPNGTTSVAAGSPLATCIPQPPAYAGPAIGVCVPEPNGVVWAPDGSLYISERAGYIQRVSPQGLLGTVAGTGACSGTVVVTTSNIGQTTFCPIALARATDGSLYVADDLGSPQGGIANRILRIDPTTGVITKVAGTGTCDSNPYDPVADGVAADTQVCARSIAVAPNGDLYVADWATDRVRIIGTDGFISSLPSLDPVPSCGPNPDDISCPSLVAFDGQGRLVVTGVGGGADMIWRVEADGTHARLR